MIKSAATNATARNIILLTLLVDDVDGARSGAIWNIYYHLYLDKESYRLLQDQSEKLHALSHSVESWHQSRYGAFLRMCDEGSLARIRKTWDFYCTERMTKEDMRSYEQNFESTLQRAKDTKEARIGKGHVLTGFRSTAPVNTHALVDLPSFHQEFWDTCTTDKGNDAHSTATHPNPLFTTAAKNTSTLHYGTDPLLGFHLAAAYASLLPESPLQIESFGLPSLRKAVEAAKVQFKAWSRSFRKCAPENMTIRLFAGDALSFCHALQHQQITQGESPAHLYRDPFHSEPLVLNTSEYTVTGSALTTFNVIDTSNLLDHLGALNLLVASSPLLGEELAATLYTEILVKRENTLKAMSDELLCGHFPTISILLGLFPVEYWTNATAISTVDEAMFDIVCRKMEGSKQSDGQMYCRFAWKRAPSKWFPSAQQTSLPLNFNDLDLANILFRVYKKMFQHENMRLLFSDISLQRLKKMACPRYHRGSLAAFLALVKRRVSADWNVVMDIFLVLVGTDSSILMSRNYIQELFLHLHIFNIHSVPTLRPGSHIEGKPLDLGTAKKVGGNPSLVSWITLNVPRTLLRAFTEIPYSELGTPPVQCIVQSSSQFAGRPWQNIFSVVQLAFGEVVTSGSRQSDDLRLIIYEDDNGWTGESLLLVSFCVPTWITCLEPETATVSFGIQSTPQSSRTFTKHFGLELNIYETYLGCKENIYITKYAPNQSGQPRVCHLPKFNTRTPRSVNDLFETVIIAVVDIGTV